MPVTVSITQLYSLLSDQMGKEKAETLTAYIENKIGEEVKSATSEIASKDFVAKEIEKVRTEIERSKTDMIKWLVGLFITLALMIIGLYIKK